MRSVWFWAITVFVAANVTASPSWAIFDGFEVHPAKVRGASRIVYLMGPMGAMTCTGTLITSRLVLTAAHCATAVRTFGNSKRTDIAKQALTAFMFGNLAMPFADNISENLKHALMAEYGKPSLEPKTSVSVLDGKYYVDIFPGGQRQAVLPKEEIGDIALLLLSQSVTFANPMDSIELATGQDLLEQTTFQSAFAFGYGRSQSEAEDEKNYQLRLRAKEILGAYVENSLKSRWGSIRMKHPPHGRSVCYGDSGGPLVSFGQNGSAKLLGILSHFKGRVGLLTRAFGDSDECTNLDDIYWTSVVHYRPWITQAAQDLYDKHGIREKLAL